MNNKTQKSKNITFFTGLRIGFAALPIRLFHPYGIQSNQAFHDLVRLK